MEKDEKDAGTDPALSTRLWSQVVVHELRERVAVLKAYCGILQAGPEQRSLANMGDVVERLDRAVGRIEQLTRDLSELARAEGGQLRLVRQVIDLAVLCREAADEQALTTGRYMLLDMPEEGVMIEGDAERLRQVLCNLALTAHRHTSFGNRARLTLSQEDGTVRLTLCDSCGGISQDQAAHLFNPHHGGDGTAAGVGLYLCKLLVRAHGGRIRAESEAGVGCTFTVELPVGPWFLSEEGEREGPA